MKFVSTNGKAPVVDFRTALMSGQAPDAGLYVPAKIPQMDAAFFEELRKGEMSYVEIAEKVLPLYFGNEIEVDALKSMLEEAYDFPIPVEIIPGTTNRHILYLDRGPTASFKDFAARLMARVMNYFVQKEGKKITILLATSGDTGAAVADAYAGMEDVEVVMLFPKGEVSSIQQKQLTLPRSNVRTIEVDGKFDSCQAFVKRAFEDKEITSKLNISTANSINVGRMLPQMLYYFYLYSQLHLEGGEEFVVSVPSGNFGNVCGGLVAKRMGLPISKLIVAVNENDEFPRFLQTEVYAPMSPSRNCLSNAMNIGHPSNLMRLVYWYGGKIDKDGNIEKEPDFDAMREDLYSISISDSETTELMKHVYKQHNIMLDPHGAVGYAALERYLAENKDQVGVTSVVIETAHPAKFPEVMKKVLDIEPKMPESLKLFVDVEEKYEKIGESYQEYRDILLV